MPLRGFIAAFVLGILASQARAADPVAYAEAFDTLYSIDLATHQATEIGRATPLESPSRYANITGLTFSPAGVLYAVSDAGATKTLLTIDRRTGLASIVGALDLGTSQQLDIGLAFTCDGALWMSARTGDFWRIDAHNATATHIGNLGVTLTGLAARGSTLYGVGSQGDNNLYLIDPAQATATPVGSFGSSKYITTTSFGFDGAGQIWTVLDYVPPENDSTPVQSWSDLGQLSPNGTLAILAPITATLVQLAVSRTREYDADREGAELCGRPLWLASALAKIDHGAQVIDNPSAEANPATAHLFIINPLHGQGIDSLFATHPPTAERIRRLQAMAATSHQAPATYPHGPWG